MRRVVITGLGLVSPLGTGVEVSWQKLIAGCSGIKNITRFSTDEIEVKVAGEVLEGLNPFEFNIDKYILPKDQKKIDRFIAYGIAAAEQALLDAKLLEFPNLNKERTGVIIGSGIGGLSLIEKNTTILNEQGPRRISPFFIPASLINLVSGHVSIRYGFTGPNDANVTACASGVHSICNAIRTIRCGEADTIIAGGAESSISPIGIGGFAAMKALSLQQNASKASRPWDKRRDGFVMGEGAGVLVLEELEHAKKRQVPIYAEIIGYGVTADAHHITTAHPEGAGAAKAMLLALQMAQLNPTDIHYINAHGTSTILGDIAEIKGVKSIFPNCSNLSISSTKSSTGHLLGAAGSVEAIFSILALRNQIMPPTLNLEDPDDICEGIDLVPLKAREKSLQVVMSNSFGFGGTNATLIMKRV